MTTSTKWTETIYSLLADKLNSEKPTDCQEYIEDLETHLEKDINYKADALTTDISECIDLANELEPFYRTYKITHLNTYHTGEWRLAVGEYAFELVRAALNDALYKVKADLLSKFKTLNDVTSEQAPDKDFTCRCMTDGLDLDRLEPLDYSDKGIWFNENKSRFIVELSYHKRLWAIAA